MLESIVTQKRFKLNIVKSPEFFYYVFFVLAILIKSTYLYCLIGRGHLRNGILATTATIGATLIVIGLFTLIFNKRRRGALFVFNVIFSIIIIADTLYFRYYSNVVTVSLIKLIAFADGATESINGLFKFKDLIYVVDLPFLFVFLRYLRKREQNGLDLKKRLINSFVAIGAGICTVLFIGSCAATYFFQFDTNNVIKDMGVLYFHYYDVKRFVVNDVFKNKKITKSEKKEIKNFLVEKNRERVNGTKAYHGIAKGKNLVLIQIEAFQQFVLNRKINGVEITPNLNKLIKKSLYFDNYYYQVAGGNTSDAEFMSNNSIYPVQTIDGAIYINYYDRKYHSLNSILEKKGYGSYAFHGYRPSFWNRKVMYESEGFDKFISGNNLKMKKKFGLGIDDQAFFQQSLDLVGDELVKKQPFFGFFVTLSSHHPFTNFKDYPFNAGVVDGTETGNFIRGANYDDKCLGEFIDKLKAKGLYDNTIFVLYGDHNAVDKTDESDINRFFNVSQMTPSQWGQLQKVPLIIHTADMKTGKVIHTTGGQVDLVPTLANLMDFKCPYAMGKDLLNTKYGYAAGVARNDSIVTDKYFFAKDTNEAYDIKTGKVLPKSAYDAEIKKFQKEQSIAHIIVKKDAFKTIKFGDDKKRVKKKKK